MRDGRRNRLGLVDGTDGTVQDTYLERILSDAEVAGEPNILSLDPDANVRTTDQRYVSDAYNYYLGGGPDAAQDDFPIDKGASTPPITRDDYPDDYTGIMLSDSNIVPPTTAPFVETSPNVLAATNVPGTPIVPTRGGAQVIVDPRTGDTYAPGDYSDVARTLAYPGEKIDDYQDPNFIQRLQNTWNTSGLKGVVSEFGQNAANMLSGLKDKGMDIGRITTSALMSALAPSAGLLMKMIPEETQIDKFNREYALGGDLYQNVVSQVDDPNFAGRLEGYSKDLKAGNIEGQDPFGKNTVSLMGNYPEYATKTFNELTEKAKEKANEGKELSQFDKDRLEYYGHVSGLTGKTNIPETPLMTSDLDIEEVLGISDEIDTSADIVDVQAVKEAIERAKTQEAAVKAEIDRQNRVREAEEAAAQRAAVTAPVPAHIIGSGGTDYQGGGGGPPSRGGAPTGTAGRNPWGRAKGGLIRKQYGSGGIVDLL